MLKVLNGHTAMLGLSETNIKLLKEGKPMKFNLDALGLPSQEIVIFYGKTEKIMMEKFKQKPSH